MASVHNPHKHTITKIPDRLWDGTSTVLSMEKPDNAVGRPIVPFRKVMGGIMHILRTGSRGKRCPENMVPVPHAIGSFKNGFI